VRTAALLIGAVLASILAVDLPVPAAEPYVPASGQWIALGADKASDPQALATTTLQQRSRDGV
jgi:hypothetical protein